MSCLIVDQFHSTFPLFSLLLLACCVAILVQKSLLVCGGTAAAAPPPSGLATLPSVGAVP